MFYRLQVRTDPTRSNPYEPRDYAVYVLTRARRVCMYQIGATDLRATSTSLLFTYTHSHALPWATAESAMAISTFSMFET